MNKQLKNSPYAADGPLANHSYWQDIILLSLFLGLLYFILLGTRPLFVPDEGRYAEIAREMVFSGDYITPTLNHIKYFEKPVLFYWLSAAMLKWGGINIWSLRSINAVLGILGCLMTYLTARQLYNRQTGLLASSILGTSVLYFMMAHTVSLDLPVSVFITFTLNLFILAINQPLGRPRRLMLYGAAIFAGLAVLTKGLIGIVFPGMIVCSWLILLGDFRLLRQLYLPSCFFIFLLVAAPWHILVSLRNPEFFNFYFITQHFLRYTTLKIGHYQPVWFFIPYLILGFFPWIIFLPKAIKNALPETFKNRCQKKNELFFLLWAGIIFIFFSFSKSKLIPYILPVIPPLAILTAHYLWTTYQAKRLAPLRNSYIALLLLSIGIAIIFLIAPQHLTVINPGSAQLFLGLAAISLLIGAVLALIFINRMTVFSITLSTASLFLLFSLAALPALDTRTILPLANILNAKLLPGDDVIAYNQYYQDLPFYLQKRVTILNWKNELSFGMQHQDTQDWMINDKTFWQRFDSPQRVFALMGTVDFERFKKRFPFETVYLIGKTTQNVLISNQPEPASPA